MKTTILLAVLYAIPLGQPGRTASFVSTLPFRQVSVGPADFPNDMAWGNVKTTYEFLVTFRESTEVTPIHERVMARLEAVNIFPEGRYARFAYYDRPPAIEDGKVQWSRIDRWSVGILDIEEHENGWMVNAMIRPQVVSDLGDTIRYFDFYYERYFVNRRGVVTYLGHEEGTGGLMGSAH